MHVIYKLYASLVEVKCKSTKARLFRFILLVLPARCASVASAAALPCPVHCLRFWHPCVPLGCYLRYCCCLSLCDSFPSHYVQDLGYSINKFTSFLIYFQDPKREHKHEIYNIFCQSAVKTYHDRRPSPTQTTVIKNLCCLFTMTSFWIFAASRFRADSTPIPNFHFASGVRITHFAGATQNSVCL